MTIKAIAVLALLVVAAGGAGAAPRNLKSCTAEACAADRAVCITIPAKHVFVFHFDAAAETVTVRWRDPDAVADQQNNLFPYSATRTTGGITSVRVCGGPYWNYPDQGIDAKLSR